MTFLKVNLAPRHIAFVGMLCLVGLVSLQGVLFHEQKAQAVESREWVQHTNTVIDELENLLSKIKDAELSQRGFMLTGEDHYLDPYKAAIGEKTLKTTSDQMGNIDERPMKDVMANLRRLTADNPLQQQSLDVLDIMLAQKLDYITEIITAYKTEGADAVHELQMDSSGKKMMDDIRKVIATMVKREQQLLGKRIQQDMKTDERFTYFLITAALVTYGILLITIVVIAWNSARIRRVEKELYNKETFFRAAAQASVDPFFLFKTVFDKDGNSETLELQYANPVAEKLIELSLAQMEGKPIEEILTYRPGNPDDVRKTYIEAIETNKAYESEFCTAIGPFAGKCFYEQAVPFADGIAINCRDITERKAVERMKNEFVSTVSHELRTPLTSIRGSLGLITGGVVGEISDQAKNLLTIAYNNCERLVRLINDILDIEKIESGKMAFDCRPTPVLPLIRQAIQANTAFADKYHAKIVLAATEITSDQAAVLADSDRLIQVLTNLISNAAKYSPAGGIITVSVRPQGNKALFEVSDQGAGIPLEFQSRIFQKFAQADSSDTRKIGGTGLGLSIVKAMVEQMNGEVGFESREGQGTRFYFTLPLGNRHFGNNLSSNVINPQQARILVCEDDPDIAHLLEMILERAGFGVDIAMTAESALHFLERQHYLAMTLDLMLPGKSGIQLIRELREEARTRDLPIIVVSAKAEEGMKELNGDAIGIVNWMLKPIDTEKLVGIVNHLHVTRGKPHVLHVEDDEDIAEVLRISLQSIAYIEHANSLEEARKFLSDQEFNLVVLDIGLPDGDGMALLPVINQENRKSIPVVLFTAGEITPEISAQVAAALTKSRTSEEKLLETIQRLIANNHPVTTENAA